MISHPTSSESSASEMLCTRLAQGIHAAAQPLTVLQASLSKSHTDQLNCHELRDLTASSALEVQRVCTLFSCLQQLVMAESIKPQLSPMPILPLLAYAADGVNLLFQQDGMALSLVVPDTLPPVLIHRTRTLEALSRVLLVVHRLSASQDMIELIASSSAQAVQIVLRNLHLFVARIDAEEPASRPFFEPAAIHCSHRSADSAVRVLVLGLCRL
jgi:hypothetical protein